MNSLSSEKQVPVINISAKNDSVTVLTGKDVQILEDHSNFTMKTDDPTAFLSFCSRILDKEASAPKEVFFSLDHISLVDVDRDRYTIPRANCAIRRSELLMLLQNSINKAYSLGDFEEFLFTMKPFLCKEAKNLYAYVRNFKMSKISAITRELDNQGNYNYSVTRKKGGAENDVTIPEKITFTLPVIDNCDSELNEYNFSVDLFFSWIDTEDGASAFFTMKNPLFKQVIQQATRTVIESTLAELHCPRTWGHLDLVTKTNEWAFVFNGS